MLPLYEEGIVSRSELVHTSVVLQTARYILRQFPSADLMYIGVVLGEKWMSCEELKYGNIFKSIDRNPIANVLKDRSTKIALARAYLYNSSSTEPFLLWRWLPWPMANLRFLNSAKGSRLGTRRCGHPNHPTGATHVHTKVIISIKF